ncbi:MAG: sigma-70 family RNA polymerase sigma factor [Calditrichaeota bacterium]|nr:sigma-70 family RNA polymerase sigma factor [Calditrichota bacterium]
MIDDLKDQWYLKQYYSGDTKAFDKIIERYKKPLFGFIFKMVQNREIAEDIFQDTFIKVIHYGKDYKEQGKFHSWIFNIAHNLCRDFWRKKSTQNEYVDETLLDQDIDQNQSALDQLYESENKEWLETAIDRLPEKQKEVVLLYVYSEMSFKDIADMLKCSINTVLGRMHYAKQKLAEDWMEHEAGN